jgi:hypothetical protein
MKTSSSLISDLVALRKKLSHTAKRVNRECGTESVIGVGSGDLLGITMSLHGEAIGDGIQLPAS